ncbi:MAG: SMP-30/gluconolactonase/LRE family protein [Candidatus Solibacter usitatus]|nr:SMP-30/gluconolactonase/LRE family protein [Candidatus Solibacter usitatus]
MVRSFALLALAALSLPAQDFSAIKVERVAVGFRFTEGPAWAPGGGGGGGYLVFSDIPNNRIHKYTPGKGVEVLRENSGGANGNAFDQRGLLVSCEGNARRLSRTTSKGAVETLADKFEGKRLNSPNDLAIRKDGLIFFTDPSFGRNDDSRELPFYGVFRLTPKGELTVISRSGKRPNGVALSPNGRILYVANSDERLIRAYDLDRQGNASGERVLITGISGVPDGIKTDEKGNIYVACAGVAIYSPEGRLLHTIEMGETPANLAFGDPDYKTLYVTARTSLYRIRLDVKGSVIHE